MNRTINEQKQKRWFMATLAGAGGILLLLLAAMAVVDPYFHYHKAIPGVSYRLYSERYMNRGIAKNFEYDALITGSSMNQNFKTSLMDELFGSNSIKIPFSGAGFEEIGDTINAALSSGNEVKYVLWGLDYNGLNREYNWQGYEEYPEYLYDNNLLNDVSYVWNKTILFEGLFTDLLLTLQGEETTTFDEYSSWEAGRGWESISQTYQRREEILPMEKVTEGTKERVRRNITENIVTLANQYPDTQFLLFYTPYSALYWESIYRDGTLEKQLELEALATELLLECDNVKLYSFARETKITENLELFRDKEHYVAEVNDLILTWIAEDYGRVTRENYQDLIRWEYDYYMNYDYDRLYE